MTTRPLRTLRDVAQEANDIGDAEGAVFVNAQAAKLEALETAARDFIAKVDAGNARSTRTYAALKAAEDVRQTREQCRRCGEGLTPWEDVPGSVRGFTSYSAPSALHERVMYGGGDWSEPREVTP